LINSNDSCVSYGKRGLDLVALWLQLEIAKELQRKSSR
jgi:hypothetical protein